MTHQREIGHGRPRSGAGAVAALGTPGAAVLPAHRRRPAGHEVLRVAHRRRRAVRQREDQPAPAAGRTGPRHGRAPGRARRRDRQRDAATAARPASQRARARARRARRARLTYVPSGHRADCCRPSRPPSTWPRSAPCAGPSGRRVAPRQARPRGPSRPPSGRAVQRGATAARRRARARRQSGPGRRGRATAELDTDNAHRVLDALQVDEAGAAVLVSSDDERVVERADLVLPPPPRRAVERVVEADQVTAVIDSPVARAAGGGAGALPRPARLVEAAGDHVVLRRPPEVAP